MVSAHALAVSVHALADVAHALAKIEHWVTSGKLLYRHASIPETNMAAILRPEHNTLM